MKNNVACIDIGSSKVLAVTAELAGHDLQIIGYGAAHTRGVSKGRIVDVDKAASSIDLALQRLERENNAPVTEVAVTMSGKNLKCSSTQGFVSLLPPGKEVRRPDILQAIDHSRHISIPAGSEQITAIPREFRVDGQRGIKQPIGQRGSRLEVLSLIVTTDSNDLDNLEKAIKLTNRKIVDVVPTPMAGVAGCLGPDTMDAGALLVDLGHGTTSVAVARNGSISFLASLPVGSVNVTNDIAQLLQLEQGIAEKLKCENGSSVASKVSDEEAIPLNIGGKKKMLRRKILCEIIESRMREIGTLIINSLEEGGIEPKSITNVVLTGGGSLLNGADLTLGDMLGSRRARVAWPKLTGHHARHMAVPEASVAVGVARISLQATVDELTTVRGAEDWKQRFRAFRAQLGGV